VLCKITGDFRMSRAFGHFHRSGIACHVSTPENGFCRPVQYSTFAAPTSIPPVSQFLYFPHCQFPGKAVLITVKVLGFDIFYCLPLHFRSTNRL
jgi:hypothetical protein